ncbi:MAG: tRNA (N6-isopentenyl adenosine(37)-C2)-methylthiotransferase MiaB [Puniceicoccales bacterium]|nr:tRNA (N6-isopentenyl adenosine(37)-C2)-methylthiotransferase MiaB [Puniceicoccales bacterium]
MERDLKNLKIFVKTYGCQMNERDSEAISAQLCDAGCSIVDDEDAADVVILNTCSIREQAEIKAIGKLGRLALKKRTNPNFRVGVVGCMAENLGATLFKINKFVDFVVGPRRLHELPNVLQGRSESLLIGNSETTRSDFDRIVGGTRHSSFLSIMQGCNMRCSYCIVPKTRGKEQYRPMDGIVEEARFLAKNGTKEITLLGQIVNGYGGKPWTRGENTAFVQLLERLNGIDGIERIRYMSPHPKYFSDDLIIAHRTLQKLCPSVHLPIQSGSNRVLKDMGRAYSRETVIEIVQKLRAVAPRIGLSTDIIVGYPGETEQEFEETVSLFDEAKFSMAFVFKYSPRAGTRSAELVDSIPGDEKERRNQILLKLVGETSARYNSQFVGDSVEILVEGHAKRGKNMLYGWTPEHCKTLFVADSALIGKMVNVKINGFATTVLTGSLEDNFKK